MSDCCSRPKQTMAFLSLLPLTASLTHPFHSIITGVLLSCCLLINASIITKPPQTPLTFLITTTTTDPSPALPADGPPSLQGTLCLEQPHKEKALEREDVLFSCLLKTDICGVPALGKVRWDFESSEGVKTVLRGNDTVEDVFGGRVFVSSNLALGDLSMTLRNVSVEDEGLYLCVFMPTNSTILKGGGTKLSIRKHGVIEESVGTIIGIVVAAVGVVAGLVAMILTQFKDKLNCLQK